MKLFEPGKIGKLPLKNRIMMAPMGIVGLMEFDGRLSQRGLDYYVERAKGGTGLIVTSVMNVDHEIEPESRPHLSVEGDKYVARLNELAEAIHDHQARVAVQLTAGRGRVVTIKPGRKIVPVAPSAVPCHSDPSITARELTVAEVEHLVKAFKTAAEVVKAAGIDAINLHGHEGYLFDQFQSSIWNRRTDKYGGDLTGRLRFVMECIDAIKKGAGADFPIIYRFGLTHYLPGGREIEEGLELARRMEAAGVAALEVDAGSYETIHWPHPTRYQSPGLMVDLAAMVKKVVKIPVIAVGKLGYPALAEQVLQEGKADFICLGRALLADPDWPNKVEAGNLEDIRPCLSCSEGCSGRSRDAKYTSCAVNPATGMEREFALSPASKKKSVLVVGGGPGGMEAARVAALRGHKVTLWEKSNVLGGNLMPASAPEFKQDYRSLLTYLATQIKKLGVTIEMGKEASPEMILRAKPDVVFLATGAKPIIPDIPGVGKERVVTASDLLVAQKPVGGTVVIVGGGLTGCETALYLAQKGKKVTMVEVLDKLANGMFNRDRVYLLKLMAEAKVKTLTNTIVLEVTDQGVTVVDRMGKRSTLAADTVVLAAGLKSNENYSEALKGKVAQVFAIGDCVESRKLMDAIWEGFRVARMV
jgi:2-enoate reductase